MITIWEKDFLNESVYGKLKIDLSEYTPGFEKQFWHTLYQRKNNSEIIEDVGEVEIKISYTRKIPEQMILHYKFSDNFEFHCIVKDFSGNSNHGNLKNLESYDVSRCKGKNRGITFSGFNWIECETNPTREVYEFSISLWFKTKNISNDYALISTLSDIQKKRSLTMDKGRSKLKQTLSHGSINLQKQIEEHNKDKSLTKYTGFLISIKKNQMYDDEGRNIILPSLDTEEEWNRQDLFKNDDWNHLVITYSGTKLHEYVNGVLTDQWNCNSQPVGGGKRVSNFFFVFTR